MRKKKSGKGTNGDEDDGLFWGLSPSGSKGDLQQPPYLRGMGALLLVVSGVLGDKKDGKYGVRGSSTKVQDRA